jgi:hypothetical protein
MSVFAIRWVAVPLAFVGGCYLAMWIYLKLGLSCFHLGSRPQGLCSDWWYANNSQAAALACGAVLFVSSVLLPTLLAPRFKQLVGFLAFTITLVLTILFFDIWVVVPVLSVLIALTAMSVCLPYTRRVLKDHVA